MCVRVRVFRIWLCVLLHASVMYDSRCMAQLTIKLLCVCFWHLRRGPCISADLSLVRHLSPHSPPSISSLLTIQA